MRRAVTAVVSVALVCAGGSNAAPGPNPSAASLEVVANRGVVGVGYTQSPDAPAPARIAVHVPDGFAFTPSANDAPIGTVVGSDVFDFAADPRLLLPGVLTIADPASFAAVGKTCTGSSEHDAVWAASVPFPGAALSIPIFVDGRAFTICTDPGLLRGTPIAIGLQLGLVSNSGIDRPLVTAPSSSGRFVWSATLSQHGQADAELLNIVNLPQRATFRAKVVHGQVRISGRVTSDDQGIENVRVEAFVTGRGGFVIRGRSRADGRFALAHRLRRGTFSVRVRSFPEQRNVTARECADGSCVSATEMILGLQASPSAVRVRSPQARRNASTASTRR